jgi:hypothetical protein
MMKPQMNADTQMGKDESRVILAFAYSFLFYLWVSVFICGFIPVVNQ